VDKLASVYINVVYCNNIALIMSIMSIENTIKGFKYLGITNPDEISDILHIQIDNYFWDIEREELNKNKELWKNRFEVTHGLTNKEYNRIKKETSIKILEAKDRIRESKNTDTFAELDLVRYIEKKNKIKRILEYPKVYNNNNSSMLKKAKEFPVNQLIKFNAKGFANRCPWHSPNKDQSSPSLKWYQKSNNVYCFSCHEKHDAIDIYCILNNVSINESIKKLQ